MTTDIFIIGAGGFGREVQWIIERINEKNNKWNLLGYIDDGIKEGTFINGYNVLGGTDYLINYSTEVCVVCAVGNPKVREKIISKLVSNNKILFPNIIDPDVKMSKYIKMGKGNIICAGNILTVNIEISDFCIINLDCTIGHDDEINSYVTIYPSVNVSGNVKISKCTELGTGSQVIQGITIGEYVTVGAGAVVVNEIPNNCVAVGCPAKPIR